MRALRGNEIAMVFQDPARSLNPTLRVGAQITEAIHMHRKVSKAEAQDRAVELMELVRLPAARERFRQYPHQLSGGMRQRVMIAIALAGDPRLLIADEATTALDVTTQAQIMELLRDLQERLGMALIMISHDLGLAASYADEVLVMYAGRAVERAATRTLFGQVRMPYTRALLGAIPRLENPPHTTLTTVPGQPPDLASQPPGCPFAPRCPEVTDKCRETAPPLAEQEPGHQWACWHPCGLEKADVVEVGRERAAVGGHRSRSGVHRARPRRREGGRRARRLGRVAVAGQRREPGAGGGDRLGQVDPGPRDPPGPGAQVGLGAPAWGRARGPARQAALEARRHMQMVFQDPFGSLDPTWKVTELVQEPLVAFKVGTAAERRGRAHELLDLVGLDPARYGNRRPRELSGGQAQRVAIARALALDPALIICDEAVSSLDVLIRAQVLNLLERLRTELDLSYLFIAHDLALVKQVSDRVAVMYLGKLVELGPAESLYRRPLHPYTVALLASIPSPDPEAPRTSRWPGRSGASRPRRSTRPAGVAFAPAARGRRTCAPPRSRRCAGSPTATSPPATSRSTSTLRRPRRPQ